MRFVGIDIGAERHMVSSVDDHGTVLQRPTAFGEDAQGYQHLLTLLGPSADTLVVMEATGHYWQNLFAALAAEGFAVALINPLRTRRFAQEDLVRTKTDAIDTLGLARFGQQKRPAATLLPDLATRDLRELVRLRTRFLQDFGDRTRQLHRAVDLTFPEFTRYVAQLDTPRATALLHAFPTAAALRAASERQVAAIRGGERTVGRALASALKAAARSSVGRHDTAVYARQVRFFCEDLDLLRRRLADLERDIERLLAEHEVGRLLTTIEGIGPQTAAKLVAELGDPATFRSAAALAAYVGAIPALRQSGKQTWGSRWPESHRPRQAAGGALDAHARGGPSQPLAAGVLPTPAGAGQASQGRAHGRPAQTARRHLRGREAPPSIRSCYPDTCAMKKHWTRPDGISKRSRC
jgi:transposase